jgi:ketosteroid isomerase-like protein
MGRCAVELSRAYVCLALGCLLAGADALNAQARPEPLPSVALPPEIARVLRDYERHWRTGDAAELAALFTEDGFIANRGGWIRGRNAIREAYQATSSALRLRAVAYEVDGRTGYIIGAYGYGEEQTVADRGMFILAIRQREDGHWLIAADLDGSIRPLE